MSFAEEIYNEAFNDELEKIAKMDEKELKSYAKHIAIPGAIGAVSGGAIGGGMSNASKRMIGGLSPLHKKMLSGKMSKSWKAGAVAAAVSGIGGALSGAGYKFIMGDLEKRWPSGNKSSR